MKHGIILFVFFVLCCVVYGQEESCIIAIDGGRGLCKSIFKCQALLSVVNKAYKTQQDKSLLKRSHCGIDDDAPAVCCPLPSKPQPCNTPEGKPGQCISVYSCPTFVNLLRSPISKEILQFVEDSKCDSADRYSVCCGPVPRFEVVMKANCTLTAFPPDPKTECCGVDSRYNIKIGVSAGEATTIYQYPWLALIQYDRFSLLQFQFSGVLISGKYVLTAGRAVADAKRKSGIPVNIRLGDYKVSNEGADCTAVEGGREECSDGAITIPIETTIPHPNYNSKDRSNDIALIRMIQNAPFTDFIRPICLPSSDITQKTDDFTLTTVGWGTSGLWPMISDTKFHADVPYLTRNQCRDLYSQQASKVTLGTGHICVGNAPSDVSCKGDNVLMYKNNMVYECVGINSFGAIPCQHIVPLVYTNVYVYMSWIRDTIAP
ncbi:unnamed protein product [Arctia plantaginis]|uniref:CLIP domain-containing serine protease n=1 Tax=Arctia plantaginis TaxID=874455 RepID=A0A8S0Z2L9_ARCPL|nr:unnamed protein product [Arctia plantaginis]